MGSKDVKTPSFWRDIKCKCRPTKQDGVAETLKTSFWEVTSSDLGKVNSNPEKVSFVFLSPRENARIVNIQTGHD
jgi:hypothetical protein